MENKMKVKSFNVGLVNGYTPSFKRLDELISELGNIKIYSLTDTFYESVPSSNGPSITRVVVYEKS